MELYVRNICIGTIFWISAAIGDSGCAPVYSTVTQGVAHDDVVYAFQVDSRADKDDQVKVIVCHRFGNPPCVTMPSRALTEEGAYAAWRSEAAERNARASGQRTRGARSQAAVPAETSNTETEHE